MSMNQTICKCGIAAQDCDYHRPPQEGFWTGFARMQRDDPAGLEALIRKAFKEVFRSAGAKAK